MQPRRWEEERLDGRRGLREESPEGLEAVDGLTLCVAHSENKAERRLLGTGFLKVGIKH